MDLDELRSVRRTERQKDSLQHLRDSFYEDVATYIRERKAERRRAADAADDPFGDPEVGQLTDEIGTAEDVVEAVYERRVGKVVKLASFAAADMSADKSGLTAEERALFDDLVDRIKRNRRTVLDTLAAEGGDAADADSATAHPDAATRGADPTTADAPSTVGNDPAAAAGTAGVDGSTEAPADDVESAAAGTAAPSDEPASEPPTPDDVLAAAMGGGDAESSVAADAVEPPTESDAGAPPAAGDADGPERDAPVADPGDSDGGATRATEDTASVPPSDGGSAGAESPSSGGSAGAESRPSDAGAAAEVAVTAPDAGDADTDRVMLRITEDVGRIYGVDEREYDLAAEDVVTLPATNAGPLVKRDAAERLE